MSVYEREVFRPFLAIMFELTGRDPKAWLNEFERFDRDAALAERAGFATSSNKAKQGHSSPVSSEAAYIKGNGY
jgi:hypothetical protein